MPVTSPTPGTGHHRPLPSSARCEAGNGLVLMFDCGINQECSGKRLDKANEGYSSKALVKSPSETNKAVLKRSLEEHRKDSKDKNSIYGKSVHKMYVYTQEKA